MQIAAKGVLAVLVVCATVHIDAQSPGPIDSGLFAGLTWRSIGPARGGRSIAVAGVKGRPREAYFGGERPGGPLSSRSHYNCDFSPGIGG